MTTKTKAPEAAHRDGCTSPRQPDVTDYPNGVKTVRCVDCGTHAAFDPDGRRMPEPTTVGPFSGNPFEDQGVRMEATR